MSDVKKTYSFGPTTDFVSGADQFLEPPPLIDFAAMARIMGTINVDRRAKNQETYMALWEKKGVPIDGDRTPPEWVDRIDGFEFQPNPAVPPGMILAMAKGIENMFPRDRSRDHERGTPLPGVTVLLFAHPETLAAAQLSVDGMHQFK